ncbi:MAG: succinate dehydrogenase, hydrophobic membrane anchor protein [Alphaproteobacteria bacterium]|nr:succinate dehydrogenase, hydrophobic membrane anchor protein [Alphaproteobacteria bacterium]
MNYRSQLHHARGKGSGKSGTHHWWMQRLTALALVPLSIWMVVAMAGVMSEGIYETYFWFVSPLNVAGAIMFIIALFYHLQLGMQVVVEDYVHHPKVKMFGLIKLKLGTWFLAIIAIVMVIRLHFVTEKLFS